MEAYLKPITAQLTGTLRYFTFQVNYCFYLIETSFINTLSIYLVGKNRYTVKAVHAVTSIKQPPVLIGHLFLLL